MLNVGHLGGGVDHLTHVQYVMADTLSVIVIFD